jgi:fatty-acyl-CoA synthase
MIDRFLNADFLSMIYEICPEFKNGKAGELCSEKLPLLRNIITLTDIPRKGMFTFRQVEEELGNQGPDDKELKKRMDSISPDDIFIIQYTSGTTAFPKGVMLHHEAVISNSYWFLSRLGINSSDRIFSVLPFYHVGGSVSSLVGTLNFGATLYMPQRFDAKETMEIIQREKCTAMFGLDTMYLMMLGHPDYKMYDLSSLKKGFSSGNPEALKKSPLIWELKGLPTCTASPNALLMPPLETRKIPWRGAVLIMGDLTQAWRSRSLIPKHVRPSHPKLPGR